MTAQDPNARVARRPAATRQPSRLVGIDAARGIALFGMFAAHLVFVEQPVDWAEPTTWWSIVGGRSSVLFATLAGVSLALVTGRDRRFSGAALSTARKRVAIRGILIFVLGILLMLLETPVAVILSTYGLLFVVLLPALSWPRRALLAVAAGLALIALPISYASLAPLYETGPIRQQVFLYYPLVTFAAYLLLGLAVGRSDLSSTRVLRRLVGVGGAMALVAYSVGEAVLPGGRLYESGGELRLRDFVFASEPHSSTLVDMVGSAGVALAVIGVCGLLARQPSASPVLLPFRLLARVGAMPLTIYSVHLVVIAYLFHSGFLDTLTRTGDTLVWLLFVAGSALVATLWGRRTGPFERAIGGVAKRVAPGPSEVAPTHWAPPAGPPVV